MPYNFVEMENDIQRVLSRIENAMYQPLGNLGITAWVTKEPVSYAERCTGEKRELSVGQPWGTVWDCAWFHFTGSAASAAAGKPVVLLIDLSGEACVFDREGCPIQGLTTVCSEFDPALGRPGKKVVEWLDCAVGGEEVDLWADAGCNDLFGNFQDSGTIKEACMAVSFREMRALYYDYKLLYELMRQMPADRARSKSILFTLFEAGRLLKHFTEEEAKEARTLLAPELAKKGGDPSLRVSAVGHAHIDLAWKWPLRETIRKGARTFSTALLMMKKYPDYVFGASQPQLYQWMKSKYPQLYEKIKLRVKEGRWEPQGAMWVEADTNITGGESLVRQILYGKRFFREEFGVDEKILWLPDTFGYTAALPQIMKKSGVDYFMTTKLSWCRVNRYPHQTFFWEGLDGSRVLAHIPPEGTYNSSAAPEAICKAESAYLDKGAADQCLMLFGIGDGGGGPGEEHLEMLKREKNLDGIAPVKQEPALEFFQKLQQRSSRYQTWAGELYLEAHQGTYTTQAAIKKLNRKMEFALRETEFLSAAAFEAIGLKYPKDELESIWKEVLLYQFHDILPGSSITRVYEEARDRYGSLVRRTEALMSGASEALADCIDTAKFQKPVILFNSLGWERTEWVRLEEGWLLARIPSMGYAVADAERVQQAFDGLCASELLLENDLLRITFHDDGTLATVYDKALQREVLDGHPSNQLAVYRDAGDAWDFSPFYEREVDGCFMPETAEACVEGPRAVVKRVYRYGESRLTQKVVLTAGSRRIDFITFVDWEETGKMLRTSFPVAVFAQEATCDIQFGNIKRPTGRNTSWEEARSEICAQKWVDISQNEYGVALLNNCKYGHKVKGNVLELNLLRSPTYPDPVADRGCHEFTYALLPHIGDFAQGDVVHAGYELNVPLRVVRPQNPVSHPTLQSRESLIEVDSPNIVVETVKHAEDGDGLIVRLYECHGSQTTASLKLWCNNPAIRLTDLLENEIEDDSLDPAGMRLSFKPYEIHTLRIGQSSQNSSICK